MLKKLIYALLILVLLAVSYQQSPLILKTANNLLYYSPCDKPLGYKIGEVDPQFGLSQDAFTKVADTTANQWNQKYGKQLLSYNPKADLNINLIFDERQSTKSKVLNMKNEVEQDKGKLEPSIEQFEKQKAEFEAKVDAFNKKILNWNSQGGAPEEEFNKLTQEQKDLKQQADELNNMAKSLNKSTADYNAKIDTLKAAASDYNSTIEEKPEGGIYNPKLDRIEIYYGSDQNELKRILTHELGHALGLEHSPNPADIMYFQFSGRQTSITQADLNSLAQICKPKNTLLLMANLLEERFKALKPLFFWPQKAR